MTQSTPNTHFQTNRYLPEFSDDQAVIPQIDKVTAQNFPRQPNQPKHQQWYKKIQTRKAKTKT